YDATRSRKLLLHHKEILSMSTKMKQKKLQIVPVRLYNKSRLIKLYLELGRPKKQFEKKEAIKRKDIQRDIDKEFRPKLQ
ncbi:MAG TPA: SsrA-binding protein, partial [Patescibacteria group bacterium]|nr:SsrA-binding protein [Patescibacteria group bacterium]